MNIQEQGFRSSLFGFDKNDVLAYMNALANEAQQHELEYNRQLQQLQSKLDELRSERGTADSRMEALKAELAAATQRADTAEAKRREADEQLETIKKKTASFQSTQRESQKNANIWQLKWPRSAAAGGRAAKAADRRARAEHCRRPGCPHIRSGAGGQARGRQDPGRCPPVRRERRAGAQAAGRDPEKPHGGECPQYCVGRHAGAGASGPGVDERLSAATLDLDGLTQAIYQALDQTEAELKDLGTDMRSFAQGTPETDIPAPVPPRPAAAAKPAAPSPEKPAERLRVKAKAQPCTTRPLPPRSTVCATPAARSPSFCRIRSTNWAGRSNKFVHSHSVLRRVVFV